MSFPCNTPEELRVLLLVLFWPVAFLSAQEGLVYEGEDGALRYAVYANRGEEEKVNRVPDFSRCGYGGGGVRLPEGVEVREVIEAAETDQRAEIQAAIDRVSALPVGEDGIRGAILLKAGKHFVQGSLFVRADGVVLLGEGQDLAERGGTELVATLAEKHNLIRIEGSSNADVGEPLELLDDYLATGESQVRLKEDHGLRVGQRIQVVMTPNDLWIEALGTGQYGWTADDYEIAYERTVIGIEGGEITLDSPLVQPIRRALGGGFVRAYDPVGRVRKCGVESMVITSRYSGEDDESHGWIAVLLERAEDCWVRNVTSRYFGYSCVTLRASTFCTVEECAALDPVSRVTGGRRYSFYVEQASSFNLLQRCYTRGGRHDVVTGSRVPGPNVFLDVFIDANTSDPGPHHRYATGILFDNVQANGVGMRVENRQDSGTGHGWSGAQIVFWNCRARDFVCDAPPTGMNFAFGFDGVQREGSWAPEEPSGYVEWGDPHLAPRSLYLAQLRDRLGWDAVLATTDWRQVGGGIWEALESWQGLGRFDQVDVASYSLSLQEWMDSRGFVNRFVPFPGSGLTAGEAYLGGVDLVGGEPLWLEDGRSTYGQGVVLNVQSRLGLKADSVLAEASEDLVRWRALDRSDYQLLSDAVLEIGVRRRSWYVDQKDGPLDFFRLSLSEN